MSEPTNKKEFIKEKIAPPKRRKKGLLMALVLICSAIVFGLISSLTFLIATPRMRELLGIHETESQDPVTIPQDETMDVADTTKTEETQETTSAESEKKIRENVRRQVDAYLETLDPAELLDPYACRDLVKDVEASTASSIVAIAVSDNGTDWFENEYTLSDSGFAIVLAKTKNSILYLTQSSTLDENPTVYVSFDDGSQVQAQTVAQDDYLGMAVIRTEKTDMTETAWNRLTEITLGNSYQLKKGDSVIALGNPLGYPDSVNGGIVSYIDPSYQAMDMNFQLIQTNMYCTDDASGILVNPNGEMIGWITQKFNTSDKKSLLAAISISDLKGLIEQISNGKSIAQLGIYMQIIPAYAAEAYDLPNGVYITSCITDGPAYNAGLQSGDVITSIDGMSVLTELEFRRAMKTLVPDTTVEVVVTRQGRTEEVEKVFSVELGTR